jgi:penicillin G amidase
MRWLGLIAFVAACGSSTEDGPFVQLPLDGDFDVDVDRPVHVARDRFGVAHISAHSVGDAAFVQGYVMAHDRLPQMDILRRFGAGTLGELFGGLSPDVIDTDLEMRMHRMTFYAEESFRQLQASSDPIDAQIVALLQRFADGVNAYATDLADHKWTLDPEVAASFATVDPDPNTNRFRRWTPIDSLVLGRFQAFALSWSTPFETDVTELYQKLDGFYDKAPAAAPPEVLARKGITKDLMVFAPVGTAPTIDGFPNVATDSGSRSDGSNISSRTQPASPAAQPGGTRPTVPQELLSAAHALFGRGIHTGPFGALGPHAFMRPYAGSNNWAVAPARTGDGSAVLATDQHLQLPNPSIFYPTHITIDGDDPLDVIGITFPGIPGVILGTNGRVAWSATVSEHDVNDVYLEDIVPCGAASGSCTKFMGGTRDLETFTEEIRIGSFGTITSSQMATYELVPHHGPILPTIKNHKLVPRTANQAMSVRYTGYTPTFEIRALWKLGHAQDVHDAFRALADFTYGSQNWTMIDNTGPSIAWTTNAYIPDRSPATYAWNATTNPTGAAPFFVLDGKGAFEWEGRMSARYVPHAIDPVQGYLATANADPVGATFDNDPLNQSTADGKPLYAGVTYAAGVREERITDRIQQVVPGSDPFAAMAAIQHDTHSNVGAKLTPPILAALAFLDGTTGAPSDVAPFLAGLPAADRALLVEARRLLAAWSFATPTDASDDSAATALFNTWMHFFLVDVFSDELAALPSGGFDLFRLDDNQLVRIVYALLVHPERFVKLATTGQPVVCDRLQVPPATASADSCSKMILIAMLEGMKEVAARMGTATTAQWAWGNLHRLTIHPLFPNTALDLPKANEFALPGFAKTGDNFNINRSDMGWSDTDFSQFADGPAQRFIARAQQDAPITVQWALPGGVIFDSRDVHYRDLLDQYYLRERHFDAPIAVPDIVENGETRWEFH